jgi:hypothetical protein
MKGMHNIAIHIGVMIKKVRTNMHNEKNIHVQICTNIRISSRPTSADYLHLQIWEMGNLIRVQIVDNQGIMHVDNQLMQVYVANTGTHWIL